MPHRYDLICRINKGDPEELHGEIPDDEWLVLTRFLEHFDRLVATRMAASCQIACEIAWDPVGGMRVTGTLPPDDELDAFMLRMRPFVLENEKTSFYKVCGMIGRRLPHPAIRALIRRQQDVFSGKDFQSQVQLSIGDVLLNAEKTLTKWLNAVGGYHADSEKEQWLRELHSPVPLEDWRPLYASMMLDKGKAVAAIARFVATLLKRGVRGEEVRFGDLDVRSGT